MKILSKEFRGLLKEVFITGSTTTGTFWVVLIIGLVFGAMLFK